MSEIEDLEETVGTGDATRFGLRRRRDNMLCKAKCADGKKCRMLRRQDSSFCWRHAEQRGKAHKIADADFREDEAR